MDPEAELERERATLAKAERDIVDGERRITEQEVMLERLRDTGAATQAGETFLTTLRDTLESWRAHRRLIQQRIAHLTAGDKADPGRTET